MILLFHKAHSDLIFERITDEPLTGCLLWKDAHIENLNPDSIVKVLAIDGETELSLRENTTPWWRLENGKERHSSSWFAHAIKDWCFAQEGDVFNGFDRFKFVKIADCKVIWHDRTSFTTLNSPYTAIQLVNYALMHYDYPYAQWQKAFKLYIKDHSNIRDLLKL